jgi:hypothetical protein
MTDQPTPFKAIVHIQDWDGSAHLFCVGSFATNEQAQKGITEYLDSEDGYGELLNSYVTDENDV